MDVHVTPETAKKLNDLATTSGRAPEDIVEDALAGYLEEVASVRKTLDSRYDDLKSGRVNPIDGEEAFRKLREKSERRRTRRVGQNVSSVLNRDPLGSRENRYTSRDLRGTPIQSVHSVVTPLA